MGDVTLTLVAFNFLIFKLEKKKKQKKELLENISALFNFLLTCGQ